MFEHSKPQPSLPKLLLFLLCSFTFPFAYAQIHVKPGGETGVGTASNASLEGKLHVLQSASSSDWSAYLRNDGKHDGLKRGLYNYISSHGLGARSGISNYVYANLSGSSASASIGFYNYTYGYLGSLQGIRNTVFQAPNSGAVAMGTRNSLFAQSGNTCYGLYNYVSESSTSTGTRYGIYNKIQSSGSGVKYGLYSETAGESNLAGYFNGNVLVDGVFTNLSDARTKERIQPISGALDLLLQVQAKSYYFKDDEQLNTAGGLSYGFLAQDLEAVLPELVKTYAHTVVVDEEVEEIAEDVAVNGADPGKMKAATVESMEIKSVNYIAMIPLLVQAIHEQQAEIEALKIKLNER